MTCYHAKVGEYDPAYVSPKGLQLYCEAGVNYSSGYVCTLLKGHAGPHVGHIGSVIIAIQDDWIPDDLKVSEGL